MIIPRIKSQTFTTSQNLFTLTAALICPGPAIPASLLFFTHSQHTLASVLLPAWNLSRVRVRVPPNSLFHITQDSAQMLLLRGFPGSLHLTPLLSNARAFMQTCHLYCSLSASTPWGGRLLQSLLHPQCLPWCLAHLWEPCKYVLNELTGLWISRITPTSLKFSIKTLTASHTLGA